MGWWGREEGGGTGAGVGWVWACAVFLDRPPHLRSCTRQLRCCAQLYPGNPPHAMGRRGAVTGDGERDAEGERSHSDAGSSSESEDVGDVEPLLKFKRCAACARAAVCWCAPDDLRLCGSAGWCWLHATVPPVGARRREGRCPYACAVLPPPSPLPRRLLLWTAPALPCAGRLEGNLVELLASDMATCLAVHQRYLVRAPCVRTCALGGGGSRLGPCTGSRTHVRIPASL
jgi:hypothetical protein